MQTEQAARRLRSVGPAEVLSRGYAIVVDGAGTVVRSAGSVEVGAELAVLLGAGGLDVGVRAVDPDRRIETTPDA